jgi:hypothetical protein
MVIRGRSSTNRTAEREGHAERRRAMETAETKPQELRLTRVS